MSVSTKEPSVTPKPEMPAMRVPLLDLKPQYQTVAPKVREVIEAVCASQQFILGREVRTLEARIAAYSGCSYGIGVSSGTDALLLAMMALGIGPGDAVITTPYTFFATAGTIARAGARPLFCDIESETFNLSPQAVRALIEQHCERRGEALVHRASGTRVKALMPVHLYGQMCSMEPLLALSREWGLKVIEDAAQAIGARDAGGHQAGSLGDVGCFSFFPTKNLGAFGDAGLCVTQDEALAEHMKVLRVHGGKARYYHAFIGGNFRLDELQAAVLNVKLDYLDDWTRQRAENARVYDEAFASAGLADNVVTPRALPGFRHIYNQYVIRARRRDPLREFLTQAGVGTEIYYPVPLHRQECFADLGYAEGDFPEAERAAHETLALPIYPELTVAQLHYVVECIGAFYGESAPPARA